MDERFLESQRREPDAGFARRLRARLDTLDPEADAAMPRGLAPWLRRTLAAAVPVAAVIALFAFPAVRATAQNLLDLFRVRDFQVVTIDSNRIEQLKSHDVDLRTLLGAKPEQLNKPAPPQYFTSIDAGAAALGYTPARPGTVPRGMALDTVVVSAGTEQRFTIDTKPLRALMDDFDVRDLSIPAGLDGQPVSMRMPKLMAQRYRNERGVKAALIQAESPEVGLPPGVDLARLGEIGLRLLGMTPSEANRLAHTIDWRSTMLLPVVASATEFQAITVHGQHGVYLESKKTPDLGDAGKGGPGRVVMWTENGRVYAVAGNVWRGDLMAMAESVH